MSKMTTSDTEHLPSPSNEADIVEAAIPAVVATETTAADESWKIKIKRLRIRLGFGG